MTEVATAGRRMWAVAEAAAGVPNRSWPRRADADGPHGLQSPRRPEGARRPGTAPGKHQHHRTADQPPYGVSWRQLMFYPFFLAVLT